jgi:hypothetical protein
MEFAEYHRGCVGACVIDEDDLEFHPLAIQYANKAAVELPDVVFLVQDWNDDR